MRWMFLGASSFNQDISDWDVGSVINIEDMFLDAKNFNQNIGRWNASNVTNMRWMFRGAKNFSQDLSDWDIGKVIEYYGFANGSGLKVEQLPPFENLEDIY